MTPGDSSVSFPYPYKPDDGREDPEVADISRVLRGGAWIMGSEQARAACRFAYAPGFRFWETGFRLVME